MNHQMMQRSALVAALLALGLAGCQKKEEAPAPEVTPSEAPAPQPPTPMSETPPAPETTPPESMQPPAEPAPGTPPTQ